MAQKKTGRRWRITYTVFCLDVWGHGPDECDSSLDCPCVGIDPDTGEETHDPDEFGDCDAEYSVNDRSRCGSIEVEAEETEYNVGTPQTFTSHHPEDEAIVQSLIDGGFLKPHVKPDEIDIQGESDGLLTVDSVSDSEPLFQLEFDISVIII